MTNELYLLHQTQIINLAMVATGIDTESFIKRIDQAETMGPVLDPSLYRDASLSLSKIKTLAQAVQDLKQTALDALG